jgi:hypothetical protein
MYLVVDVVRSESIIVDQIGIINQLETSYYHHVQTQNKQQKNTNIYNHHCNFAYSSPETKISTSHKLTQRRREIVGIGAKTTSKYYHCNGQMYSFFTPTS